MPNRMLKKSASFVLAALRGSTYRREYASPLRLLWPRWTTFSEHPACAPHAVFNLHVSLFPGASMGFQRSGKQETADIRLLLVDDHEVLRLGLRTLFSEAGGFHVVGEAGTMTEAIAQGLALTPDVVLMDVRLPDGSGIEACREIRAGRPETRVLFLTSFADDDAVLDTILQEPTDSCSRKSAEMS